jgi:hypothetical protein
MNERVRERVKDVARKRKKEREKIVGDQYEEVVE